MQYELLTELYGKYYHRAYLYALSLCREKSWAEDIVSEAFEKAMLTLEDGGQGFLYWLLRVCRNLFLDEVRRRKRRPAAEWQEAMGNHRGCAGRRACRCAEKRREPAAVPRGRGAAGAVQGTADTVLLRRGITERSGGIYGIVLRGGKNGIVPRAGVAEKRIGGGWL